ncbi:hypothetical protein FNH04_33685 [Streptomyces phyllanthi]|uniref:Fumarylacetoacetase-like C-terminal domain-containing protein n=1 Tax=Streptomyces phyllanthi TaxID=1803180 RepID=A0A5N8WE12_9ACTN|nr:hypothetical protein [Streptomyces phyllanthi]
MVEWVARPPVAAAPDLRIRPTDTPLQPRLCNYALHIDEVDREVSEVPMCFMKPSTAGTGSDDALSYPVDGELIRCQGELVVVIGKEARHVKPSAAHEFPARGKPIRHTSDRKRASALRCSRHRQLPRPFA